MSMYRNNKERAKTRTTQPTLTDQSAARHTDINIIVPQFLKTGHAPGSGKQPLETADFTQLPNGLREMMDYAAQLPEIRKQLPPKLQRMSLENLLQLTPERLNEILNPSEQTDDKKEPHESNRLHTPRPAPEPLVDTSGRTRPGAGNPGNRHRRQRPRE